MSLPKRPFTTSSLTSTLKSISSQPLLNNLTNIDKLSSQASSLAHKTPFFSAINPLHHNHQQQHDYPTTTSSNQNNNPHQKPAPFNNNNNNNLTRPPTGGQLPMGANQMAKQQTPPVDMSHLTEEERLMIQSVMQKAELVDQGLPVVTQAPSNQTSMAHQQIKQQQQPINNNQYQQQFIPNHPSQPQQQAFAGSPQTMNPLQQQQQHQQQAQATNIPYVTNNLQHNPNVNSNNSNNLMNNMSLPNLQNPQSSNNNNMTQQQQFPAVSQNQSSMNSLGQQTQNLINQINNQFQLPSSSTSTSQQMGSDGPTNQASHQQQQLNANQQQFQTPSQLQQLQSQPHLQLQFHQQQQPNSHNPMKQPVNNQLTNYNNSPVHQEQVSGLVTTRQMEPVNNNNNNNTMMQQNFNQQLVNNQGQTMQQLHQQQQSNNPLLLAGGLQSQNNFNIKSTSDQLQALNNNNNDMNQQANQLMLYNQQGGNQGLVNQALNQAYNSTTLESQQLSQFRPDGSQNPQLGYNQSNLQQQQQHELGSQIQPLVYNNNNNNPNYNIPLANQQQQMIQQQNNNFRHQPQSFDLIAYGREQMLGGETGFGPAQTRMGEGGSFRRCDTIDLGEGRVGASMSAAGCVDGRRGNSPREFNNSNWNNNCPDTQQLQLHVGDGPQYNQDNNRSPSPRVSSPIKHHSSRQLPVPTPSKTTRAGAYHSTNAHQARNERSHERPTSSSTTTTTTTTTSRQRPEKANNHLRQTSQKNSSSTRSHRSNTSTNKNTNHTNDNNRNRMMLLKKQATFLSHSSEEAEPDGERGPSEREDNKDSRLGYQEELGHSAHQDEQLSEESNEDSLEEHEDSSSIGGQGLNSKTAKLHNQGSGKRARNNQANTNDQAHEHEQVTLKILSDLKLTEQATQVMEQQQLLIKQSQELIRLQLEQQALSQELKRKKLEEQEESSGQQASRSLEEEKNTQLTANVERQETNQQQQQQLQSQQTAELQSSTQFDYPNRDQNLAKLDDVNSPQRNRQLDLTSDDNFKQQQHIASQTQTQTAASNGNNRLMNNNSGFEARENRQLHNLSPPHDSTDSDLEPISQTSTHNKRNSSRTPSRHHQATSRSMMAAHPTTTNVRQLRNPTLRRREPSGLPPSPLPVAAAIHLHQMQQQHYRRLEATTQQQQNRNRTTNQQFLRSRSVTNSPNRHLLGAGLFTDPTIDSSRSGASLNRGATYSPDSTMSELASALARSRIKRLPEPPSNAVPVTPAMVRDIVQAQRSGANLSKHPTSVNAHSTRLTNLHSTSRIMDLEKLPSSNTGGLNYPGGSSLLNSRDFHGNSSCRSNGRLDFESTPYRAYTPQLQSSSHTSLKQQQQQQNMMMTSETNDLDQFLSSTYGQSILKNATPETRARLERKHQTSLPSIHDNNNGNNLYNSQSNKRQVRLNPETEILYGEHNKASITNNYQTTNYSSRPPTTGPNHATASWTGITAHHNPDQEPHKMRAPLSSLSSNFGPTSTHRRFSEGESKYPISFSSRLFQRDFTSSIDPYGLDVGDPSSHSRELDHSGSPYLSSRRPHESSIGNYLKPNDNDTQSADYHAITNRIQPTQNTMVSSTNLVQPLGAGLRRYQSNTSHGGSILQRQSSLSALVGRQSTRSSGRYLMNNNISDTDPLRSSYYGTRTTQQYYEPSHLDDLMNPNFNRNQSSLTSSPLNNTTRSRFESTLSSSYMDAVRPYMGFQAGETTTSSTTRQQPYLNSDLNSLLSPIRTDRKLQPSNSSYHNNFSQSSYLH